MTATATPTDGRQRIMDTSAALFLERGLDGTSLRTIADLAGMKAASLYYHFSSKDDLIVAIFRRGIDVMQTAFDAAEAAAVDASPRDRIGHHVRAHLSALFENGPYTAAHVTAFRTAPPAVRAEIVPIRDGYEARWTTLLRTLVDSGDIDPTTPIGLTRLTLFGAMNTTIDWFDTERGSLDDLAELITDQFWTGVQR